MTPADDTAATRELDDAPTLPARNRASIALVLVVQALNSFTDNFIKMLRHPYPPEQIRNGRGTNLSPIHKNPIVLPLSSCHFGSCLGSLDFPAAQEV